MAQDTFVDFGLHLNRRAWAVLHLLDREPDFAPYDDLNHKYEIESETYAFYNGRERGFTIRVGHPDSGIRYNRYCYVVFSENRSSDDIVIIRWVGERLPNPPRSDDFPAEAWRDRKYAKSVEEAVKLIVGAFGDFLRSEVDEAKAREVMES